MVILKRADVCMFKRLSSLFGAKPAKKKAAAAPRKDAALELEEAAAEMGLAAAGMKRAAAEMNRAVSGNPPAAKAPAAAVDDPAVAARIAAQTRQDLIRQAMQVRRDKARALENLPAQDRKRLRALAEKMMLGGPEAETPPGTPPRRRH